MCHIVSRPFVERWPIRARMLAVALCVMAIGLPLSQGAQADAPGDLFPEIAGKTPAQTKAATLAQSTAPIATPPVASPKPNAAESTPPWLAPITPAPPPAPPAPENVVATPSETPASAADTNAQVAKVLDYYNQVQVLAINAQKLAVTAALQRLFETVIKANTPALRSANPEEAARLDDLQKKLGDVMARAAATDGDAPGLSLDVFGKPTDWPKAININLAIKACGDAWKKAAADRDHCQMQAADKAASDLQPAIEAAIQHGDAAEAARISTIRNQYVIVTRGGSPANLGETTKIDLLKLVNVSKDAVAGKWTNKDGALQSNGTACARVAFVYQPPEEYDYRVSFSRESGKDCIALIVVVGGHQTCWEMGANGDTMCRFETATDASGHIGPSSRGAHCLVANGRYECVIQVRKTSMTLMVNGQTIGVDKANPGQSDLWTKYTMPPTWKLPDGKALGLGTWKSSFKIYAAEVKEISGHGKVLR